MRTVKFFILAALLLLAAGTANSADRVIFPDPGQARADLAAALKTAAAVRRSHQERRSRAGRAERTRRVALQPEKRRIRSHAQHAVLVGD